MYPIATPAKVPINNRGNIGAIAGVIAVCVKHIRVKECRIFMYFCIETIMQKPLWLHYRLDTA